MFVRGPALNINGSPHPRSAKALNHPLPERGVPLLHHGDASTPPHENFCQNTSKPRRRDRFRGTAHRRGLGSSPVQRSQQVLVARRSVPPTPQIHVVRPREPGGCGSFPVAISEHRNELLSFAQGKHLSGHYVSLIANSSGPHVRLRFVFWSADHQDVIVLPHDCFHELRELVSRGKCPLVERHLDAITMELLCKAPHPLAVACVIPGIRDEHARWDWSLDRRCHFRPPADCCARRFNVLKLPQQCRIANGTGCSGCRAYGPSSEMLVGPATYAKIDSVIARDVRTWRSRVEFSS